jgi:hypothetical protein
MKGDRSTHQSQGGAGNNAHQSHPRCRHTTAPSMGNTYHTGGGHGGGGTLRRWGASTHDTPRKQKGCRTDPHALILYRGTHISLSLERSALARMTIAGVFSVVATLINSVRRGTPWWEHTHTHSPQKLCSHGIVVDHCIKEWQHKGSRRKL